ncbi:MAG: hypothetical protein IJZ34_10965 [Lachnospiraceae bacterium]|nr:hypothetical protein [Lachnospiraceae bacterium]
MRMRRSRLKEYYWKPRIQMKDNEGSTYEEWGAAISFKGECWPASGKVQAQQYGERLSYIRNLRIEGKYETIIDENGMISYKYENGMTICESDGICLYVGSEMKPDYKVISIKPYIPLKLEVERI